MDYLLKSSALILLMYLGYVLFLKKETFFSHNRWFLVLGILTALILPLIEITVYIPVEPVVNSNIPTDFMYSSNELVAEKKPFEWSQLLNYIYITGVIIFLIQFLFQFGSLLFLLVKNAKNKDGIYTYVVVKSKVSPFSFFKWIVYNPSLFSDNELQLILNHEKVHVRQWHSLDILISRLFCVALWFNPLVWLYHKNIQQNLEYIADADVQKHTESSTEYQELLLKTSIGNTNINLTSNFYNSLIKKRIVMLQKHQSKSINRWKTLVVLPFFALFLLSFNTREVLVETAIIGNTNEVTSTKVEALFTHKMSNERLDEIKKNLKKEGVEMTLNALKRNTNGFINKIDITFNFDGSSASYKAETKEGIKSFRFIKFENGMIMVGPTDMEIIEVVEEPEIIDEEIIEIREEPIIEVIEEEEENEIEIEADSVYIIKTKPKTKANYVFITKDSIVTGKPNTSYSVKVNGNVKVNSNSFTIKTDSVNYKNTFKINTSNRSNPIYIVNGKRVSNKDYKKIDYNDVAEVNVIKGKRAATLYGDDAKNGIVTIKTNKGKNSFNKIIRNNNNNNNDNDYNVQIGSIRFEDDDKNSKMALHFVTKDTPDNLMETHKKELAAKGITIKYSKLKRNKKGEIVRLKIAVKDKYGNSSIGSFNNTKGIPTINFGKYGDDLVVSSKPF